MCYCCVAEGHLSIECPEQHTRDKKDWFVKKAISAHQHEASDNGAQNTNNGNGNNTNANGNGNNDSRSVQWNNPVGMQNFQT